MDGVPVTAILPPIVTSGLREAFAGRFDSAAVEEVLGLAGRSALERGDLIGVERVTDGAGDATATLIRLFMLGLPVDPAPLSAALPGLALPELLAAGLLDTDGRRYRSRFDLRPYGETDVDWWVLSDLGGEVRPGPLPAEHVLGIGTAATTLAQATVRRPVGSALDVGTGCGVQALHLSRHATAVTATDLSTRALAIAAANAALNGQDWRLLHGSLLQPVDGETFDLVVSNPPFIVGPGFSPGDDGYRYRDSGLSGDSVCRTLITGLPSLLNPGGHAQLLANWEIRRDEEWPERLGGWLQGSGCDAWVWQREVAEPGEYIALWLRDAGEQPGSERWRQRYQRWADWFTDHGVIAVGMGLVSMRRTDSPDPVVVCEDVPQATEPPIGPEIAAWLDRARWLAGTGSDGLTDARLHRAADLVMTTDALAGDDGWADARVQLRQSHGMRWALETDAAIAGLVAAMAPEDGTGPDVGTVLALLAAVSEVGADVLAAAVEPTLRDLIARGFLLPGVRR